MIVELLRQERTSGGMIIPSTVQDPQGYGKVLSVGEDVPDSIKEDDILVFHIRAGMDMLINKKFMKCVKHEEVYGKITSEEFLETLAPYDIQDPSESRIVTAQ